MVRRITKIAKKITNCLYLIATNQSYRIHYLSKLGFYKNMPDEKYLHILYEAKFKKPLRLNSPITFNEKLQWLKLNDRKPEYSIMVDKYAVKQYVAERIGGRYVIPTLGVWDSFKDIDFASLPNQFVLKCTHDSGGLVICRDKSKFDYNTAKKIINKSLKRNYFFSGREWPYKNVKPRVIAEQYMQDGGHIDLPVYKFFCFDGEPRIIQVIQNDKQTNETIDYFDIEWNRLELRQNFPNSDIPMRKPVMLDEMLNIASQLSKEKAGFIRTDLYVVNGKIYFSEYTFFTDSGLAKFIPEKWDETLGALINLPTAD